MLRSIIRRIANKRKHAAVAALVLCLACSGQAAQEQARKDAKARPANRLAYESSPYLLQHAHNPVAWYPWGDEAFAKAKKEGKLVFLSIGYSSCHWCHVMERESFENDGVAKLLNDWFVCIKVDREERPDIDAIYMAALNVQGNRGGWPLSMFLTAEAKPIVGGTYWPTEDRQIEGEKVSGFKSILKIMHDWQTDKKDKLQAQADRLAAATTASLAGNARGIALIDIDRNLVDSAVEAVRAEFDNEHGGFGSRTRKFQGPKFPVPSFLELLLSEAARTKSVQLAHMATFTLEHMARGGIYDQLAGGFHRYSTERTWTVPHFEKMLYDNAQLAELYARAYQQTANPLYRRILEETLAFVEREMTSPQGGFYSALDADSSGVEGLFYVWTDAEIGAVLPNEAEAALVKKVYGAEGATNFEGKYHIFVLPKPLAETAHDLSLTPEQLQVRLAPLRQLLLEKRGQRPRPFLDNKILTGWNGQMIAGFASAGHALTERKHLETAARAAEFILKNMRGSDGRLLRSYGLRPGGTSEARLNAYLDDYAYLAHGLLCLHDATHDARWLGEARTITDTMIQLFADKEAGGFYFTSSDHEKLFARSKDQYDGAQPSGNSVAARNLVRLWTRTGDVKYRALAEKTFKSFAIALKTNPTGSSAMASALALYLDAQPRWAEGEAGVNEVAAQEGGAKKSDSVVKAKAEAEPKKPGADGKQVVTVTLTLDKGFHIYANPPGLEDLVSVQTEVIVTSKTKLKALAVEYPKAKEINDPIIGKYKVYEDKLTIKASIERAPGDTGPLQVSVKLQSCNDSICLLPATIKLSVP